VIRQHSVGNGFHEELTILNHDDKPVELMVRLEADCDFADLFKDALKKKGAYCRRLEDGRLVGEHLLVDPALPSIIGHLEVLDIPGRWSRVDAFARGRVDTSPSDRP
jgi:hypothetical protein